ncbi:MAG: hypothetical protein PHU91_05125 [Candidatus Omnitrophica bacterium]|nr:hypothetical protein [Candidatus Omnitrophota bacterium]MDD5237026.1 hypothetical protein [Candidatus Omnitrophota bacterium]MDD5610446.1 hypothetical protein [Candidatus Omnitrophota bacterium]
MSKIITVYLANNKTVTFSPRPEAKAVEIAKRILIEGVWDNDVEPQVYFPPQQILKVEVAENVQKKKLVN